MKAVVYEKYGSPNVLKLKDVTKPTAKNDEVLVRVRATSINQADLHFRSGSPFLARMLAGGLTKPKIGILGFDVAGEIESVGGNVRTFSEGDHVYGFVSHKINGANAEYTCVPVGDVMKKPDNISFEEAAAVPIAASQALLYLQAGETRSGQRVLLNGASGGLGCFAVQIAKSLGAKITGVCSTRNLELVSSLGADEVIDYTKEDFTKKGQIYDTIFDVAGKSSFSESKGSLSQKGTYVTTAVTLRLLLQKRWNSLRRGKKVMPLLAGVNVEDHLNPVNDLIVDGKLKPVVDRSYPLSQVAEAHRHVEKGLARGKVVVTV